MLLLLLLTAIPFASAFHVSNACTPCVFNSASSFPPRARLAVLRMAAGDRGEGKSGGAAARKTQSLTSPVRKTDRRSPTRIIAKPSANARSTMSLGGDKVAKKTDGKKNESKIATASPSPNGIGGGGGGGFLGGSFNFEDFQPPFAQASVKLANGLTNNGPFAWMAPYVDLFGYRPGKALVGAIPQDPTASPDYNTLTLTPSEISERRAAAEQDLTNISPEERERRAGAAEVALKACGAYAIFSSLILDHDDIAGHLARFLIILPLFAWRGLDLSAKSGL